MNTLIFKRLIQIYGCKPKNWPLEHRAQMLEHTRLHPNWLEGFKSDIQLDDLLSLYRITPPSHTLVAKILQKSCSSTNLNFRSLFSPMLPKFSALTAALILGLSLGFYQYANDNESDFVFHTFIDIMPYNTTQENEIIL